MSTPAYNELEQELKKVKAEYEAFVKLVYKMRDTQTRYFNTRNSLLIPESKKIEAEVDKAIRNYGNVAVKERTEEQQKLF